MGRCGIGGAVAVVVMGAAGLATWAADPADKKPSGPAEVARLDARLKDVSESFLRETTALIGSYESIGEYDRAKFLLEALRKLNPGNEVVKKRLEDIERRQLDAGEFTVEIDPKKGWTPVGLVKKDRPVRIRVKGEYRFTATATVGANGVPVKEGVPDLAPGVPLGAVMGAIVAPAAEGRPPAKPPRPFLVGTGYEQPAEAEGILYLKANLPAESNCTGHLEAVVGGATKP